MKTDCFSGQSAIVDSSKSAERVSQGYSGRLLLRFVVGITALPVVGCGGGGDKWTANLPDTVEASGVVTLDDEPVSGAALIITQVDGEYSANAVTADDGSFSLQAYRSKDGVVPGTYMIAVSKTEEIPESEQVAVKFDAGEDKEHDEESGAEVGWRNILPARYASPATSELQIEVPASGSDNLQIGLTK